MYVVDIPSNEHETLKEKGIITAALSPPCGHASQVFIDAKGKCRGGQVADIVLDAAAIRPIGGVPTAQPGGGGEAEKIDLIGKLASDIIVEDARDTHAIKAIGAEEKVDIAETALLSGYPDAARIIFSDLRAFCLGIDDYEFAESLARRIEQIDKLVKTAQDISEVLAEIERDGSESDAEIATRVERQLVRLDEVLVDLQFSNLQGDISNNEYEYKRARLLALKARVS